MNKKYTSLGLMSGTSGDGVDASIVKSDGNLTYAVIMDEYFEYNQALYQEIHETKDKVNSKLDLSKYSDAINILEKKITIFHAELVNKIKKKFKFDLIGFHGQTIYHNSDEKISKQLGTGGLLSQLTFKDVVYNFRENDILSGGEGAPLSPIFHDLIIKNKKIKEATCILNIGGISNITIIFSDKDYDFESKDIGPGNCLLEQALELYSNRPNQKKLSLDTKDFDISFARGLSLEDGATTLTDFTSCILSSEINNYLSNKKISKCKIFVSGGGRKNSLLINKIKKRISKNFSINLIEELGFNGDFIESQAFAYLAIRSILNLPISFPKTTGCKTFISGGNLVKF
jgi:anhydro-N-acetylmuramic acid kinase